MYNVLLNALKNIYTPYKPTIQKIHNPVIKNNYKVMGDTRFIPILVHKDDKIQWDCIMSIYMDAGEPETLNEFMTRPNENLW